MPKPPLPDFENPPVIEVVCSIQFEKIKFTAPHFGLLWERYKADYPSFKQVPPLSPKIEKFDNVKSTPNISFQLSDTPPLPRVWYIHKNENGIIQVQEDRFVHNWRKNLPEDEYPRYPMVIGLFKQHFHTFITHLKENEIGPIEVNQFELTYVNHIFQEHGWSNLNDMGNIFEDYSWNSKSKKFLPEISNINLRTTFDLPNQEGRLHIKALNGINESGKPVIRLDLSVNGMCKERTQQAMWKWFDQAREWIVRGFADFTNKTTQEKVWGRRK